MRIPPGNRRFSIITGRGCGGDRDRICRCRHVKGQPIWGLVTSSGTVIIDWFDLPECRRHECGILVTELIGIGKPNRIRVWCHDKVVSCMERYAAQ